MRFTIRSFSVRSAMSKRASSASARMRGLDCLSSTLYARLPSISKTTCSNISTSTSKSTNGKLLHPAVTFTGRAMPPRRAKSF